MQQNYVTVKMYATFEFFRAWFHPLSQILSIQGGSKQRGHRLRLITIILSNY